MRKFIRLNKGNFIILLLIAGIVSIPLMTNYVIMGSSTASSLAHIENIYVNLGKAFPIRIGILEDSPYGYSVVAFQADTFYRIPVLFRLIGVSLGSAFKFTLFLFNIFTSFTAFFSFRKCFGNDRLGLVVGMLYTWFPYRVTSLYTSGNLSEVFAWTFLPIIILGLWKLYGNEDPEDAAGTTGQKKSWVILTWGFSLVALSSTVFLFIMVVLSAFLFLIMWRKSFRKNTLIEIIKTIVGVVCINAWFVIPMLIRMRDPEAVALMIAEDVRSLGMFFAQYLTVFHFAGNNTLIWTDGMCNAPAYGPGAAVTVLVFVYLYLVFIGAACQKNTAADAKAGIRFHRAILCTGTIFIVLSTNTFPWDIFQNKNMLFSIMLALMENPARWGIAADLCLMVTACFATLQLGTLYGQRIQRWTLFVTAAVSFGTTQFMLDNILTTCGIANSQDIAAFGNIELPVIYVESTIWRICEVVSLVSVLLYIVIWFMRKKKYKK